MNSSKMVLKDYHIILKLLFSSAKPSVQANANYIKRSLTNGVRQTLRDNPSKAMDEMLGDYMKPIKKSPISEAVSRLPKSVQTYQGSNILCFKTESLIDKSDFDQIYPDPTVQNFDLSNLAQGKLNYTVHKGRYPLTLNGNGFYYLIFNNHVEAACFLLETSLREINGIPLRLEFVSMDYLPFVYSPLLGEFGKYIETCYTKDLKPMELFAQMHARDPLVISNVIDSMSDVEHQYSVFNEYGKGKLKIPRNNDIIDAPSQSIEQEFKTATDEAQHFIHKFGRNKIPKLQRNWCVSVRGVSMKTTDQDIFEELWDYELFPVNEEAVQQVYRANDYTFCIWLLRFANGEEAERFVRNYHGGRFTFSSFGNGEHLICEVME